MTSWIPNIADGSGPLYVRLADSIEMDMASGRLPGGTKLPPQRNLAFDIGVTIGTIGRGYQLAIERGLLIAEVGRGTFVRGASVSTATEQDADLDPVSPINIRGWESEPNLHRMNSSCAPDVGQVAAMAPLIADIMEQEPAKVVDYVRRVEPHWQQAGVRWMGIGGWHPDPGTIFPTQGVHAAMTSIIAACTAPGDKIVFEDITYASIARAITALGRRVITVRTGKDGLDPDDLESVCAQQHPKLLVTVPTLHNPTSSILPLAARRRVAEIAEQHNLLIVEDNIYGLQVDDAPQTIAELAPDRTFHVSGLSKSVAAGVRAGWASCPTNYRNRVTVANKSMTGGNAYLMTELAARMVNSGVAHRLAGEVRKVSRRRQQMVSEIFAGCTFESHPCAPYFWLRLEEPWLSGTFKAAALQNNIVIDDAEHFKVARDVKSPHRVRIAIGAIKDEAIVRQNLVVLRELMDTAPGGFDDYS